MGEFGAGGWVEQEMESVEEGLLRRQDVLGGSGEGEPRAAVDLGYVEVKAGPWGPLDDAEIAGEHGGVAVALDGEGGDYFAACLLYGAEGVEGEGVGGGGDAYAWRKVGAGEEAGFFVELAAGSGEVVFAGLWAAFGDSPDAEIFVCPEGASGVDEEDFGLGAGAAEEKEAGAFFQLHSVRMIETAAVVLV